MTMPASTKTRTIPMMRSRRTKKPGPRRTPSLSSRHRRAVVRSAEPRMLTVCGIDPSFSGLGIVAIPSNWACSLKRVRRKLLASKPGGPLVDRICDLACDVSTWIDWARGKGSVEVFIEGGIQGTPKGSGASIKMQIELAAVIKHELRRELGIEARVAEQNRDRQS